jgi:hypothetical protein
MACQALSDAMALKTLDRSAIDDSERESVTDTRYEINESYEKSLPADVDADLARNGRYWSYRQCAEPAETPTAIWTRAGLIPLDVPYERSHGELI